MDRKFRAGSNERFDVPDAQSIHDLADDGLRAAGRVLHTASEPGLTVGGVPFAPVAAVVYGFEVEENPLDNQQVLITPGVALCEEVVGGALSGGQISTPRAQRPLTIGGALVTKYVWARFVYVAGDSENRAFWQPSAVPEFEAVQLHDTRFVAEYQVAYTDGVTPPAAGAGWFLLAEVDYSGGTIAAVDIADRRVLLFEGQAAGTDNPATEWTVPEFDRSDDRSTIGSRSLFGWIMRIARRIAELGGRDWFAAPAYGENVRSASGAILVSADDTQAPHFSIGASPTRTDMQNALLANLSGDARTAVQIAPQTAGGAPTFSLDTSGGGMVLSRGARVEIGGEGTFRRSAGTSELGVTPIGGGGWKGTIRNLSFLTETGGSPLLSFENDDDDLIFINCRFQTNDSTLTDLVQINSAGRYVFIGCRFLGAGGAITNLVSVQGTARVDFKDCQFGSATAGARRGIYIPAGTPAVCVYGCTFDTLSDGVESLVGTAIAALTGCTFTTIIGDDVTVAGFYTQAAFDGGAHHPGQVVGDTLRANGSLVYMDGNAFLTMNDGAGSLLSGFDGVARPPDALFDNYYANDGRYLFGNTAPATTGDRLVKLAAGAGGGGDPERFAFLDAASVNAPTLPLHARRLILGDNAADLRAVLSAQVAVKAWGVCRYVNGSPDTQDGGGWRYDEAGLTVTYTNFNPGSGAQQKWQVSGLGLANDEYAVIVSVSAEPAAEANVFYNGAAGGYYMNAVAYNKTAGGFDLAPVLCDQAGRISLDDGNLNANINSYDINFIVIAHDTVL